MRLYLLPALISALLACDRPKTRPATYPAMNGPFQAIEIKENNTTPTVDISRYTLITDMKAGGKSDAEKILQVKRKWPLLMQSPTVAGFDSILSRNFTFTDGGHLLNRADYIRDRTQPSEWKITHVKYQNLTLQFLSSTMALLTYQNRVTNQNTKNQAVEIEYISWADIYRIENEKWKIASAHVVDFRMEPVKQP